MPVTITPEKIKEIARENGIPIVENRPVAQALYRLVEIDREIPPELYETIAEILMFAWKVRPPRSAVLSSPEPVNLS